MTAWSKDDVGWLSDSVRMLKIMIADTSGSEYSKMPFSLESHLIDFNQPYYGLYCKVGRLRVLARRDTSTSMEKSSNFRRKHEQNSRPSLRNGLACQMEDQ